METMSPITKYFLEPILKKSPNSLETLNQGLLVCFAAYVIKKKQISEHDSYFRKNVQTNTEIYIRDLIYDVIHPNVPKELREAVDVITAENKYCDITEMTEFLLNNKLNIEDCQKIANDLAVHYYPMVITESITTPASINELCLSILNPINGSFYDSVAGLCSTCIAAGRYAKERNGELLIYAQEKLEILCAVSTIRAYINEIEFSQILSGDVFTNPRFKNDFGEGLMRFDYSIMFPPLGSSWSDLEQTIVNDSYDRFKFSYALPKSNSEWLFIEHQAASLADTGRGIIAVSTGTLYNSSYSWIRRHVIEEGYIECIITLPSKILSYTTMPLSLIVINKAKRNSAITMIQAEGLFSKNNSTRVVDQLNKQVINKIVSIYNGTCMDQQIGRVINEQELLQNDCILLPSRYISSSSIESELGRVFVDLSKVTNWPVLKNISDKIYRGMNVSKTAEECPDGKYRIINYADIQDGNIILENLKTYHINADVSKYVVQPGDVLVSCKGVTIKTCVVPDGIHNILLSINFVGIRLNKEKCDPYYLKYCLDSPVGQAFLKGRQVGTSIITLKNKDFEEFPISLVPITEQKRYIAEFEKTNRYICNEIEQLHRHLIHEKWQFYQHLGLGEIITRIGEDYQDESN